MKNKRNLKINGQTINAYGFGFDGCHKFYLIETPEDEETLMRYGYKLYDIMGLPQAWVDSCPLRFINSADLTKTFVPQFEPARFEGDWNIDPDTQQELDYMAWEQEMVNKED